MGDREGAEVVVAKSLALQCRPLALVLRAFVRQRGGLSRIVVKLSKL
ncbi:hypothetical protein Nhal_2533 [Nitrosococcus halophilus Nc 4]|uniref:Uncharacterized protein n=2 Tax=Nitrosococcus halophilus TaxID=133539 RepID=D5BWF6_NITHN|nr:hypothetical protein Nhal_2533 [Nitrosococcus halophilus Nc 4]